MNCRNCGAALPPDSLICAYCNSRQDVDLTGIHRHTVEVPESDRMCPRCQIVMPTINIKQDGKFLIERCNSCMGLFFDPGELEALLEEDVQHVYQVDHLRLNEIHKAKRSEDYPVAYIKCPVCGGLMNRMNFGSRSGVIVDRCKNHGIWLDGGELRQIMEWVKAGGQIHNEKKQAEMERLQLQQEREKLRNQQMAAGIGDMGSGMTGGFGGLGGHGGYGRRRSRQPDELVDMLFGFVGRLLR